MIFILHYLLFNAGTPAILILLTLYLQTYSDASLTEIGALLMVLPFISIIMKPLFCALADRQKAHKHYLTGSLLLMAAGYGSLAVAPFFPDFVQHHGRLVWYLDILGVIVGFCAFGVTWSLGDALSVNAARIKNIPWSAYRVWGTVSWGVFGYTIGQINELPFLPKYVPAFFMLFGSLILEAILVSLWPNEAFDMSAAEQEKPQVAGGGGKLSAGSGELAAESGASPGGFKKPPPGGIGACDDLEMNEAHWPTAGSLCGTLSGSARLNPRLMGAMAGILMEDIGGSIKSSLKLGQATKRTALADVLREHNFSGQPPIVGASALGVATKLGSSPQSSPNGQPPAAAAAAAAAAGDRQHSPAQVSQSLADASSLAGGAHTHSSSTVGAESGYREPPPVGAASTLGRAALRRTQHMFSRMNSLSSASGHAIAEDLRVHDESMEPMGASPGAKSNGGLPLAFRATKQRQQVMTMSSLASQASLSRAVAARELGFGHTHGLSKDMSLANHFELANDSFSSSTNQHQQQQHHHSQMMNSSFGPNVSCVSSSSAAEVQKSVEDLQMVLLKLIIKRNASILKFLILFTVLGMLFTIHCAYFFLHVEEISHLKGYDFSSVTGSMLAAQSVSEIFCFLVIVPHYTPRVGRIGSILTALMMFVFRFAYYGTYYADFSPYTAAGTEVMHGVAYGIVYSLITDIATECVNQVDDYMPELIQRGIIHPTVDPNELKLPLRATMQGVFSGAFDGLGNGVGALFAGIYLDSHHFTSLWIICTYLSVAISIIYPLTEWRVICGKTGGHTDSQKSPAAAAPATPEAKTMKN